MSGNNKEIFVYFALTIAITILIMMTFSFIPGYFKEKKQEVITGYLAGDILIFLIADFIFIIIFSWLHNICVRDYSEIKSILFFSFFGSIFGVIIGEGANPIMIIPYFLIMLIYSFLYKHFLWWKVAITSYPAGILIENVLNRSPLQATTLIWAAILICPYFATKIWDNRGKINFIKIFNRLKIVFLLSLLLGLMALYFTRNNISPPLIILGLSIPFLLKIFYDSIYGF